MSQQEIERILSQIPAARLAMIQKRQAMKRSAE